MPTINKREQTRILKNLHEAAEAVGPDSFEQDRAWSLILIGAITALNTSTPTPLDHEPHGWACRSLARRVERRLETLSAAGADAKDFMHSL